MRICAEGWHHLVPLHSNRSDIERELGKTVLANRRWMRYETTRETVTFSLTTGESCEGFPTLPSGTIIYIELQPTSSTKSPSDFGVDDGLIQRFEPLKVGQTRGFEGFIDSQRGVAVRTVNRFVETIFFLSENKDNAFCKKYYPNPRELVEVPICNLCPAISVSSPEEVSAGSVVTFTFGGSLTEESGPFALNWTVEGGTIVEGQATTSIKVATDRNENHLVIGRVQVLGVDPSCNTSAQSVTKSRKPLSK